MEFEMFLPMQVDCGFSQKVQNPEANIQEKLLYFEKIILGVKLNVQDSGVGVFNAKMSEFFAERWILLAQRRIGND